MFHIMSISQNDKALFESAIFQHMNKQQLEVLWDKKIPTHLLDIAGKC